MARAFITAMSPEERVEKFLPLLLGSLPAVDDPAVVNPKGHRIISSWREYDAFCAAQHRSSHAARA